MNRLKKYLNKFLIIILLLIFILTGCNDVYGNINIKNGNYLSIEIGEEIYLECNIIGLNGDLQFKTSDECVNVNENGLITGIDEGNAIVTAYIDNYYDEIIINVTKTKYIQKLKIITSKDYLVYPETMDLKTELYINDVLIEEVKPDFIIVDGNDYGEIKNNILISKKAGTISLKAIYNSTYGESKTIESELITINIYDKETIKKIDINCEKNILKQSEKVKLQVNIIPNVETESISYEISNNCIEIVDGYIYALKKGNVTIRVFIGDVYSNYLTITIIDNNTIINNIELSCSKLYLKNNDEALLTYKTYPITIDNIEYHILEGKDNCKIENNKIICLKEGIIIIEARYNDIISNKIIINDYSIDPYTNISSKDFYSNYSKAISYMDAYYRSEHGFMSGDLVVPNQEPVINTNQPKENDTLIKNSSMIYSDDQNIYFILNETGKIVGEVYRDGAYITLEEVSAYIFAFNDVPKNYTTKKKGSPSKSIWGEYLRVNHSFFSGDISKYPYEPILPNISGCGGNLMYYELDLGTTGTDCDPSYDITIYNDGKKITRGAARIVYARYMNDNIITDINNKYLFYTFNHYNDFQEYLNYQYGWGEIFGNITGGGKLSSTSDYNPTTYKNIILKDFINNY